MPDRAKELVGLDISASLDRVLSEQLLPLVQIKVLKEKPVLTPKEVEILYGIPASSLRRWRAHDMRRGPAYYGGGQKTQVFYTHQSILEWLQSNSSTGDVRS